MSSSKFCNTTDKQFSVLGLEFRKGQIFNIYTMMTYGEVFSPDTMHFRVAVEKFIRNISYIELTVPKLFG